MGFLINILEENKRTQSKLRPLNDIDYNERIYNE